MGKDWQFILFIVIFLALFVSPAYGTCPPDCGTSTSSETDSSSDGFDLFETDPTQAVTETTGLEAEGVTAAEPREDGGASIERANSLTTDAGRRFENVQGTEVDADGNVVRADHIELAGSSFEDVEDFAPIGDSGFSAAHARRLDSPVGSVTDGAGIASDGNDQITVDSAASVSAEGITAFDAEGFVSDGGIV